MHGNSGVVGLTPWPGLIPLPLRVCGELLIFHRNQQFARHRYRGGVLLRDRAIEYPVATHNSECSVNIGVLRRPLIVAGMLTILSAMVSLVSFRFRRRASLELEVLALRHQVAVLHRQRPGRAWLGPGDRLLWAWLYRAWPHCLRYGTGQAGNRDPVAPARIPQILALALMITPRWAAGVNREIRELVRQMSVANPLWGAPRIHGEMLKLGIEVSQATVGRYMAGGMVLLPQHGGRS